MNDYYSVGRKFRLSSSQPLLTVLDYQDLQDDSDNDNDDCMAICFQGQIQKKEKNSIDLWPHLLFGIIWSWKKGSFKLNFWSNLAPRETINVRLIQFSNQIETIGAQECLKNILCVTIVIKLSFSTKLKLLEPKSVGKIF